MNQHSSKMAQTASDPASLHSHVAAITLRCGQASANRSKLRQLAKRLIQGFCLLLVFPAGLLCGFGHFEALYSFFAQILALAPGIPGNFLRSAFYKYVLRACSVDSTIAFGTFFSRRDASIGSNVSIGSYCVIGRARIGAGTQISSHVEIPSGRHEHSRDELGHLVSSSGNEIQIGENCWIGASAVVLADVGAGTTVGAGSVVVKALPANAVAVGNPARTVRFTTQTHGQR